MRTQLCWTCKRDLPEDQFLSRCGRRCAECREERDKRKCTTCQQRRPSAEFIGKRGHKCAGCRERHGRRACRRCGVTYPKEAYMPRGHLCPNCYGTPPPSAKARHPRRCFVCHKLKPARAFPMGGRAAPRARRADAKFRQKRRSTVCQACWDERERQREERRATRWRDGVRERRCPACSTWKELEAEFYRRDRRKPPEQVGAWEAYCKVCSRAKAKEGRRRRLAEMSPEEREARREIDRAQARARRARNVEVYREAGRRHRRRIQADPVRRAHRLESRRISYRLKREREGRPVKPGLRVAVRGEDKRLWLPAAPFVAMFERVLARELYTDPGHAAQGAAYDGRTLAKACEAYGVNVRRWQDYREGRAKHIDFRVADKVLQMEGLHWWDVWDEADLTAAQLERLGGVSLAGAA